MEIKEIEPTFEAMRKRLNDHLARLISLSGAIDLLVYRIDILERDAKIQTPEPVPTVGATVDAPEESWTAWDVREKTIAECYQMLKGIVNSTVFGERIQAGPLVATRVAEEILQTFARSISYNPPPDEPEKPAFIRKVMD